MPIGDDRLGLCSKPAGHQDKSRHRGADHNPHWTPVLQSMPYG
jgi:hypothetical protein